MQGIIRLIFFAITLACSSQARGQTSLDPVLERPASQSPRSAAQTSNWSALKEQADAEKAAYEAQTAAAKAQAALYEAQAAAVKLKYGGIAGQSEIKGATTVETGSGKPEAMLLVSLSSQDAGVEIYNKIQEILISDENKHRNLIILQGRSSLALHDAIIFDAKVDEVNLALSVAQTKFKEARKYDVDDKPLSGTGQQNRSIPAAGALIDSAAKLASYFLTDYKVAPVDATFEPTAVTYALISNLKSNPNKFSGKIFIPELSIASDDESISKIIGDLTSKYIQTIGEQAESKARQSALLEAKKAKEAGRYAQADAAATKAIELYDSMMAFLSAPPADPKQDSFIVRVAKQYKVREKLVAGSLVLVLEGGAAAQYYTKKNIWTFFGGPPVYTAGAVTVSFALIDYGSGELLSAGVAAKHGGYQSIKEVERLIRKSEKSIKEGP